MEDNLKSQPQTLIIINPHAGGGRARKVFHEIEDRLAKVFGELLIAVTEKPEEVGEHLDVASRAGITQVLGVGGDGTNHVVFNALAQRHDLDMTYGNIPVGTGSDWSRALGVPKEPERAVDWLLKAQPIPCDLGKLEFLDMSRDGRPAVRLFLNIASAGISGEVDSRVNRAGRRTSLTFLLATIATLFKYDPQRIRVLCDEKEFYSGPSYLLAVANGRFFGRGMWVAPHALINDGLFDVVLAEGMPRRRILLALRTIFSGRHLQRRDVHHTRAASVRVRSEDGPLALDMDGEEGSGQDLHFSVLPGAVKILLDPATAPIKKG
jgi:YegS/Rv2252/BmrU family lipid kinase